MKPSLLFYFTLVLFSSYIRSQNNLIENPSFENGTTNWSISGSATRIMSDAKDGTYAIKAPDNSGANQTVKGLKVNTTYVLTGWFKSSANNAVQMGVKLFGGNELIKQTSSTNYTLLTLKFTTGPASTSANVYCNNPTGGSNQMFADHFSLLETDENPYELVWSDEFNGNGVVDATKWSFENGFVRNEEVQWYQSQNATMKDGNLIIEGRKEVQQNFRINPNFVEGSNDWRKYRYYINYTASSIKTQGKHSWLYGRFEIRAKVTNLVGTWPAIWTLGDNCEWPSNGEVDIMENYGGNILGNFAWGTNTRWSAKWDDTKLNVVNTFVKNDPNWLSKFHIWTLDWDENRMSIYVDDRLVNEVNLSTTINGSAACAGDNPFKKKQYLLLNLALGGQNGGSVANLAFPTQYIVDYVRVYQINKTLSTQPKQVQETVSVYPNPVKNVLYVKGGQNNSKYKILDVSGRLLLKGIGAKVDVSKLSKGVYLIQVDELKAMKFIKE